MSPTGERVLRLLSLLQARRHWPGAELAQRLGVSVRTLRRDVGRLRELGYPVDAERGVDGGYRMAPGAALPPLVLDDEEAVALTVGLLAAVQSPVAGSAEASARALGKVVAALPRRLSWRVEALARSIAPSPWRSLAVVDSTALTVLAQACRDAERVALPAGDAPHGLVPRRLRHGASGLAHVPSRPNRRTGRHRRALRAPSAALRRRGRIRAVADLPDARPHEVEARVLAPAASVRDRIGGWASVEGADEPEACTVRLRADSLDWAAFALLTLGARFEMLTPSALRDHLRAWGERLVTLR